MKNPADTTETRVVSQKSINRRNFISFAGFAGFGVLSYIGLKKLFLAPNEATGVTAGAKQPLRNVLNQNEKIFRNTFSHNHLVKTYPKSMAAKNVRHNSDIGMDDADFDVTKWSMEVTRKDGSVLKVTMDEIRALPKTEIVYDFKCVEGWDQISYWGGVRFADFMQHYDLHEESQFEFVALTTPSENYYVGLDMPSALHPQTLLAYEVNAQPLPVKHGAPLRLIIPVKYGIKNLKRIGKMKFSNERPRDYWAERGYDYYSGL
jgi:DMSO/TMAO reductase YedYZ molybdopterin-dependent catalytic subunit